MADQTGIGKSKEKIHEKPFRKSGKLAMYQILKSGPVSAVLMSEISNELTCHGNAVHANMYNAGTCSYNSL